MTWKTSAHLCISAKVNRVNETKQKSSRCFIQQMKIPISVLQSSVTAISSSGGMLSVFFLLPFHTVWGVSHKCVHAVLLWGTEHNFVNVGTLQIRVNYSLVENINFLLYYFGRQAAHFPLWIAKNISYTNIISGLQNGHCCTSEIKSNSIKTH